MTVVALTGGIAAGKSAVSRLFEELGAVCLDADDVSREVVEPGTPALRDIVETFGPGVLRNGALDRQELGRRIFRDARARSKLNAIVHPRVRERTNELIRAAETTDPQSVIIYAIPLLVESNSDYSFDKVIAVSASVDVRVERLMKLRGLSEDEARARIAAQADESARLALADFVIDTNGTMEDTQAKVRQIWTQLTTA